MNRFHLDVETGSKRTELGPFANRTKSLFPRFPAFLQSACSFLVVCSREAQTGNSIAQCKHPQGRSECHQVFTISCDVEGEFNVSNWMLTCG